RRSDAVVLYRSNAQSRELEEALLRVGMPYRIYGGFRFYERLEIRNTLAYLKLLVNRHDDAAMERVLNVPVRGIGNKTQDVLRQVARMHNLSMWQAACKAVTENLLPGRAMMSVKAFLELIDGLDQELWERELAELVAEIGRASGRERV